MPSPQDFLQAQAHSRFASRILPRLADLGLLLSPAEVIDRERLLAHRDKVWPGAPDCPEGEAGDRLRRFRNSSLLAILARDLSGAADLSENLESITLLAELCIDLAYQTAARRMVARHGIPLNSQGQPTDLLIVGMGKLGGRELNASSDIDLIPLIEQDGESSGREDGGGRIDLQSYFTQLVRHLSALLSEQTAEGLAFRVDLRLRPNGSAGPVVHSLDMLEQYLVVQGREWERYAWIKARVVNQPYFQSPEAFACGVSALEAIRKPFVFRGYLDFNALAALRDLHHQIQAEAQRRQGRRDQRSTAEDGQPDLDLKLGRGGIREIEFIAQLFQLIRGGREPALQHPGTRVTLDRLASLGRLNPALVARLQEAYAFWRRLEHRLQYWEDAQTHVLPGNHADLDRAAAAMGLPDRTALLREVLRHQQCVAEQFDLLFRAEESTRPDGSDPSPSGLKPTDRESRLKRLEAQVADLVAGRVAGMVCTRPEATAQGLGRLLDALAKRTAYLALFDEYPETLVRVARVIDASDWASDYLRQHPIVLDELLDARNLSEPPDLLRFGAWLKALLDDTLHQGEPDVERQMDQLREAHHAQLFRLLVQDLDGRWTLERLSDQLSLLADQVVEATVHAAWRSISPNRRHRDPPAFAVIAYGKLGGKELGYASDLDLIFLHDDPHELAQEHYARLAQRINVWLSTTTAAGSLFEIDLRLRPNGNAGLLVTDLQGFVNYQRDHAWVWEHQALTRARFCAGDPRVGAAFEAARSQLICLPRPLEPLLEEILAMRARIHEAHPNPSQDFDLKHDQGGMVDIEFMVQALVLAHSHDHPGLSENLGNIALLGIAARAGLIPGALADQVAQAYRCLRQHQHRLRLSGARAVRLPPGVLAAERAAVMALWAVVFDRAPRPVRSLTEIRGPGAAGLISGQTG